MLLAFFHLHRIAQRAAGARNDGDLMHRRAALGERRHQRVTDLMIRNDQLLFVRDDRTLLLIARDDRFNGFFQVLLDDAAAAVLHRQQGGLIDHVGQLRAAGAGTGTRDRIEIDR